MKKRALLILIGLLLVGGAMHLGTSPAKAQIVPGGTPDYFGTTPNWAFSPLLTKFVDTLPGICGAPGATNSLGQCIPLAVPQVRTFNGVATDYYEIELVQYRERMHSEFPALNVLDKMAATSGGTKLRGYRQTNGGDGVPHYLGPLILATKDRPVRIKFTNALPAGAAGKLFVPVDTTIMGSGPGPDAVRNQADHLICQSSSPSSPLQPTPDVCFAENRGTIHLHGGRTPWISDGTAHQWITPAAETNPLNKGASVQYVPDMWYDAAGNEITGCAGQTTCGTPGATNNSGPGKLTFYYSNQQSARLLFYHDHAWGITRLNVYVGEAAGYLLTDPKEESLINAGTIPGAAMPAQYRYGIPLIIQDKTFVDATTIVGTDPTWNWGSTPGQNPMQPVTGDLWWPHVYMPAENPANPDLSGVNPMGRWPYGPWFFPPTVIPYPPVPNPLYGTDPAQPPVNPGTPNPSWGAEAFLDTPLVNGTAYPTITLQPQAYRFRVLNAAHDRFFNLQFYRAANKNGPTTPGAGTPVFTGNAADLTEVAMVPAAPNPAYPEFWPNDGREGGAPDPATRGPAMVQIGTEGGFLPGPVLLPNQPVNWVLDPTLFTAGLVAQQNQGGGTLHLGPAERADVIVDFSAFAGHTLILYNDAPAPWPALDPHYDYYTGAPDRRAEMGGADSTLPGKGPNIRTLMQIVVAGTGGAATPDYYNPAILSNLQTAFAGPAGVFASSQDPIIVGQTAYNEAYGTTFPSTAPNWGVSEISDTTLSFKNIENPTVPPVTLPMKRKAIQDEMGEVFDDYGRLSAKIGLQLPFATPGLAPGFVVQNFVDPATEILHPEQVQIWKITHNGVDTHPVHFHLYDVQLINRVGWDGFKYMPDPNELGWKETVRISPLEDTIVALRPKLPTVPFPLPNSSRYLNPAMPANATEGFTPFDPYTGQPLVPPTTNVVTDFGHEYTWHCHILSHEESDMMRPVIVRVPTAVPAASTDLAATATPPGPVNLTWTYVTGNEIGFKMQRCSGAGCSDFSTIITVNLTPTTYNDATVNPGTTYRYRVVVYNMAGDSLPSNIVTIAVLSVTQPAAPTNLTATPSPLSPNPPTVVLVWTDNATNEMNFILERALDAGFTSGLTTFTIDANVTAYTDITVAAATICWYRVRAVNLGGSSANAVAGPVTTPGLLPAAPTFLAATVSGINAPIVNLTWADNSDNETNFRIERATNANFTVGLTTFTVGAGVTAFTDTTVLPLTQYFYRVIAFNALGDSSPSNTAAILTTAVLFPTPTNLVATASAPGIFPITVSLTWTDTPNETSFIIQRATDAGFTAGLIAFTVGMNVTAYTDTAVAPTTTYWYRVFALNALDSSLPSNIATVTTPHGPIYLPLILSQLFL